MRLANLLLATTVLLAACTNKEQEKKETTTTTPYDYTKLEGSYRGDFGGSGDILVVLRHVTDKNAVGYDLHKGLRRNISGELLPADKGFKFVMQEPGDNQYDGVFEFMLDTTTNQITGNWKPTNTKTQGTKTYTLKKDLGDTSANGENNYARMFTDSIGELHFQPEGLCLYRYYPKTADSSNKEQYIEVKGNWRRDGDKFTIDWQKNDVFAHKQTVFTERLVDSTGEDLLEGEGRTFYLPMD